jgi:S1-C subfamily serine protease
MSTSPSRAGFRFTKGYGVLVVAVLGVAVAIVFGVLRNSKGPIKEGCALAGGGLTTLVKSRSRYHSGIKLVTAAGVDLACTGVANAVIANSPKKVAFKLKTDQRTYKYNVAATQLVKPVKQAPASELGCLEQVARTEFFLQLCRQNVIREPTNASPQVSFSDLVEEVKSGVIRVEVDTCNGTQTGTGILLDPRFVATVEHVVAGASNVRLTRDGETLGTAQVVGSDRARDLALLQTSREIVGHDFQFARQDPRLGEEVAVLGFPLQLPLSVAKGSVSGLQRTVPIGGVERRNLVQTDAAVNHGNSGGPLISTESHEVVGLVDMGASGAHGIAFAVSGRVASPLLEAWRGAPQPLADMVCGVEGSNDDVSSTAAPGRTPSVADYAEAVDAALIDSARTRANLADLIDAVNAGSIGESEARTAIAGIIDQRRALLHDVTVAAPPVAFRSAARLLLRRSLVAALVDDLAIEGWLKARYAGNDAAADDYWARQVSLSRDASRAKAAFLRTYNAVRAELLGLSELVVDY